MINFEKLSNETVEKAYDRVIAGCREILTKIPSREYPQSKMAQIASQLDTFVCKNPASTFGMYSRFNPLNTRERNIVHLNQLFQLLSTTTKVHHVDMENEKAVVYKSANISEGKLVIHWEGEEPGNPYWKVALAVALFVSVAFFIVKRVKQSSS